MELEVGDAVVLVPGFEPALEVDFALAPAIGLDFVLALEAGFAVAAAVDIEGEFLIAAQEEERVALPRLLEDVVLVVWAGIVLQQLCSRFPQACQNRYRHLHILITRLDSFVPQHSLVECP